MNIRRNAIILPIICPAADGSRFLTFAPLVASLDPSVVIVISPFDITNHTISHGAESINYLWRLLLRISISLGFTVREPNGGFDYVKPEPTQKKSTGFGGLGGLFGKR
jgi:hypothetical protein